MKKHDRYCLVLSGGGARGIYHVGVWRALRELEVSVNAFVGNSIGAIVAGFLAQGAGKTLEEIANTISLDYILKVPDELIEDGELKINRKKLPRFRPLYRNILKHHGLDTTPLRELLYSHLDEEKIRSSGNDLGVVTFNVSGMKAEEIFVDEMAQGTLIDYLLASAAFPGFEKPMIRGKRYVDGGVYDNMPYAMARRRGYKRIIVVDISGPGVNRRPHIEGGETVYIKNSIKMGGVLDFNRKFLDDFMELGYLDTMRAFDRLKGYKYFLKENENLEKRFRGFLENGDGNELLSRFLSDHGHEVENPVPESLRLIFPRRVGFEKNLLLVLLDCAADVLDIERVREYSYAELYKAIREKQAEIDGSIRSEVGENGVSAKSSKRIETSVKHSLKREDFEKPLYYYYTLPDFLLREKVAVLLKTRIFGLFPKVRAASFLFGFDDRFRLE